MGGCCCCSSKTESDRTPVYFYCPQQLEDNAPLTSTHLTTSAVPVGLLVDTNLETSSPDTYRAPPAPLPYDVGLASSESVPGSTEDCGTKTDSLPSTDFLRMRQAVTAGELGSTDTCEGLKGSDCKSKNDSADDSPKVIEEELSKLNETVASAKEDEEEDVCPTCLEEYDVENPRIITKCEHHFHLSCILEWMERSNTCPMCDQIMMIDHTADV